jgi:hypothetical protein
MILKLKNQLIKIDVSAERADERRSIGLDGVLIEDAEQADRAAQKDAQLIRALSEKKIKTILIR